ncbi:MAG: gamma-glutamyl-gamma-aminobutyrate hydrolase family protein [Bacteroidia bacterium]
MKSIIIGITDCSKWKNYHDWFASKNVAVLKLSPKKNNVGDVDRCNGIVLSGGEDVHPKYYGHPEWMKKKGELKLHINEARDKFELKVIGRAVKNKKPILGICRGLQIANVYFKGTLIPDLQGKTRARHSKANSYDQMHEVKVEKDSCLSAIIKTETGKINSAHHQAADKIGKGLKVSARAGDGTIEAIELKNSKGKPFFLLVQWHPERMKEQKSVLAKNIKKEFLLQLIKK